MYKEASKLKLRILTTVGLLTIEQLWDLSTTELDTLAVALEEEYKKSGKKSFLIAKSKKDKILKLKFDIVVNILTTKVDDAEESLSSLEKKAHNDHILGLIADKKNDELRDMSVDELEKLIK